jgi:hypothetical protein
VTDPLPQITSKKRWLLLSHAFNMDGRAASQTITDKIPYFLDAGVELTVFSSITGIKDTRFPHYQFLAWGPAAFRFDFRHWFANQYGRGLAYKVVTTAVSIVLAPFIALERMLLGFSSQWSWAIPAYLHGKKRIQNKEVDVVYSTAGAWSAQLAALWLKKSTGVFWMTEIHDPLVIRSSPDDEGFGVPPNRDARFRKWLEAQICKHADLAWWFTDGAVHYATLRNPKLNEPGNAKGVMVIPGAEPPGGLSAGQQHVYTEHLKVCHFGSLAKDRSLSTILKACIPLFQKYPEARHHLRLHAYGAPLDSLTLDALNKWGFEDVLIAHGRLEKDPITGKLGRERVVEKMQSADVLLLMLGHEEWCTEYIPSKFYEYLWAGRPIWGISHRNPQLDHMLQERGSYICSDGSDEEVATMLETIWLDWRKQQLIQPIWKPIGVDQAVASILNHVQGKKVN